ncbi:TrkH-domain-containing protein [Saitoella complicata NRRL Y-17804]|uniref:Potassium transport protein n=1 Tax=Saitoella complicata (strain BCRC 22490 / CBS 7301 / JCM 7358 / NBRC 10748 / NRRL Y-17804) TaxID=698492 RepID=A0A0E9NAK8_SAICN|nr:TrkH-domain-containing protein [Saitoella complicata NRRL Y-17804]ODQ55841.1 TrkH-domain-containing protein [Saitoella complicata NRRL Y-17804]GAO46751.1 hypothetical protein G7K_0973-t1 [Saitoella complicata NRRL Y-17804]
MGTLQHQLFQRPAFLHFRRWPLNVVFPDLNFITVHYAYFIFVCLVSSGIFWGASRPVGAVSYVDSLFLVVSAMSLTGLNTINLSTLNTFQQFLLFFLILIGSSIFVSAFVVWIRTHYFAKKFKHVAEQQRKRRQEERERDIDARRVELATTRRRRSSAGDGISMFRTFTHQSTRDRRASLSRYITMDPDPVVDDKESDEDYDVAPGSPLPRSRQRSGLGIPQSGSGLGSSVLGSDDVFVDEAVEPQVAHTRTHISFAPPRDTPSRPTTSSGLRNTLLNFQGVGASATPARSLTFSPAPTRIAADGNPATLPMISAPSVGRNSTFMFLTKSQREELGGVEYRAIRVLGWLVPAYYILWQLLGSIGLGWWMATHSSYTTQIRENGINPWWLGAFNTVSAFNNSGMSLLDANVQPFFDAYYVLITMSLLILAGNTMYPVFLRIILWLMRKVLDFLPERGRWAQMRATVDFLLEHPRRCYTNLFGRGQTLWLAGAVFVLNSFDWFFFEILNLGNSAIEAIPTGPRIMDGLFQAFAVRSGGFYVVNIATLRIGVQVLYVVMMYISAFPIALSIRNTNVYEERSLGIYAADMPGAGEDDSLSSRGERERERLTAKQFVTTQLRAQLAHDLWWLALAVWLISIVEYQSFEDQPANFSIFNVIFEVVSAYGTVGLSVGFPNVDYSFSGALKPLSKLIMCAVMLRGRHRGLPVAIDRAVLLKGEDVEEGEGRGIEEEDGMVGKTLGDLRRRSRLDLGWGPDRPGAGRRAMNEEAVEP